MSFKMKIECSTAGNSDRLLTELGGKRAGQLNFRTFLVEFDDDDSADKLLGKAKGLGFVVAAELVDVAKPKKKAKKAEPIEPTVAPKAMKNEQKKEEKTTKKRTKASGPKAGELWSEGEDGRVVSVDSVGILKVKYTFEDTGYSGSTSPKRFTERFTKAK